MCVVVEFSTLSPYACGNRETRLRTRRRTGHGKMISLALVSLIFGLAASWTFSAAPFVAGNVLAIVCIFGLGLLQHWSWLHIAANLAAGIVALQAGFLVGNCRQGATRPPSGADAAHRRERRQAAERRLNHGSHPLTATAACAAEHPGSPRKRRAVANPTTCPRGRGTPRETAARRTGGRVARPCACRSSGR